MTKLEYLESRSYQETILPGGQRVQTLCYDSAAEMVRDMQELRKLGIVDNEDIDEQNWRYGSDKNNLESTEEALIEGSGSTLAMEMISKMTDELLNHEGIRHLMKMAESKKRRRVFKDEGSELSIDRVLCGDPEHWEKMTPGAKKNVVRLAINSGISCGNSEKQFAQLIAFTCAATDMLTRAGRCVEVVCIQAPLNSNEGYLVSTPIISLKKPDEPLDIQRLSSAGLPGLFRKEGFDLIRCIYKGDPRGGYGQCLTLSEEVKKHLDLEHLIELSWSTGKEEEQILNLSNLFERITGELTE